METLNKKQESLKRLSMFCQQSQERLSSINGYENIILDGSNSKDDGGSCIYREDIKAGVNVIKKEMNVIKIKIKRLARELLSKAKYDMGYCKEKVEEFDNWLEEAIRYETDRSLIKIIYDPENIKSIVEQPTRDEYKESVVALVQKMNALKKIYQSYSIFFKNAKKSIYICLFKHYVPCLYTEEYYTCVKNNTLFEKYMKGSIPVFFTIPSLHQFFAFSDFVEKVIYKTEKINSSSCYEYMLDKRLSLKNHCAKDETSVQINMHWLNNSDIKNYHFIDCEGNKEYVLNFNSPCDFQLPFYQICKNLQFKAQKAGCRYIVTIKSSEFIADHFNKYNNFFLYAMYFNWFSNITFKLTMPKKQEAVQRKLLNVHVAKYFCYFFYDLNYDMGSNKENDFLNSIPGIRVQGVKVVEGAVCILYVCCLLIDAALLEYKGLRRGMLMSWLSVAFNVLGSCFSTHSSDQVDLSLEKSKIFFPWYVIYALSRDIILIHTVYKYGDVLSSLFVFQVALELLFIRKSLFWIPLFKKLYNINAPSPAIFYT